MCIIHTCTSYFCFCFRSLYHLIVELNLTMCCAMTSRFRSTESGRGSMSLRLRASSAEEIQSRSLCTSSLSASIAARPPLILWSCWSAHVWTWEQGWFGSRYVLFGWRWWGVDVCHVLFLLFTTIELFVARLPASELVRVSDPQPKASRFDPRCLQSICRPRLA